MLDSISYNFRDLNKQMSNSRANLLLVNLSFGHKKRSRRKSDSLSKVQEIREQIRIWGLGGSWEGAGGHFYCTFSQKQWPESSIELFCFNLD